MQVDVEFSARGTWEVRQLLNPEHPAASRLCLALAGPARDGFVRMTVSPAAAGALTTATKLASATTPEMLADPRQAPPGTDR